MIQRCTNPNNSAFRHYGKKGISVCNSWLSFENFKKDMGERPDGKSLDRIDSNGNYEPSNCRWADKFEQSRNRSRTKLNVALASTIRTLQSVGFGPTEIARKLNLPFGAVVGVTHLGRWPEAAAEEQGELLLACRKDYEIVRVACGVKP